jgi:hypothetical protein
MHEKRQNVVTVDGLGRPGGAASGPDEVAAHRGLSRPACPALADGGVTDGLRHRHGDVRASLEMLTVERGASCPG